MSKETQVKEKIVSIKPETYKLIREFADMEDRTIRSIIERAMRLYKEKNYAKAGK